MQVGSVDLTDCLCIRCSSERRRSARRPDLSSWPIRFACEVCGNKRCPHHTDHRLACTGSNRPGQPGSIFR
jgi:hypothetical protein